MRRKNIENITGTSESTVVEWKPSLSQVNEIINTIAAFVNTEGGKVFIGVSEAGKLLGCQIGKGTIENLTNQISQNTDPKVHPRIITKKIESKEMIIIEVKESSDYLVLAFGRPYKRVGKSTVKMSKDEYERLVLEKHKEDLRWDKEICTDAKPSDVSSQKLKAFLKKAGLEYRSIESSLNKLGLAKNKKLLNTAVILFGKRPERLFPNAKLRCAVFGREDTSVVIDMQDYKGDVFYLIGKAEEYILKNIHIGMKIEGLYRVDIPEIDKESFREAIINAFCHRDYCEYDSVNIAIFKDRVEIRNPGLLYGGLTIEQIKKEMVSERRNELIAEMFHRVHFVEKWGRGISLILSKEPDAEFKEIGKHFIAVFRRKIIKEKPFGKEKTRVKTRGKTRGKIIVLLTQNPEITGEGLAKKLGISVKGIEWQLNRLKKEKAIKRIGSKKSGYWEVAKELRGHNT